MRLDGALIYAPAACSKAGASTFRFDGLGFKSLTLKYTLSRRRGNRSTKDASTRASSSRGHGVARFYSVGELSPPHTSSTDEREQLALTHSRASTSRAIQK